MRTVNEMAEFFSTENCTKGFLIIDNDVKICAGHGHVAVADGVLDLGERLPISQRVVDKGVAAVMDGQAADSCRAEHSTGGKESPTNGIAFQQSAAAAA